MMRSIYLNAGPVVHFKNDGTMSGVNSEDLIYDAGKAIVVDSNVVERIDETTLIENEYDGNDDVSFFDLQGKAVVPGFIDTHTHLLWSGDRNHEIRMRIEGLSYAEISDRGGGIQHTTQSTRQSSIEKLHKLGYVRLREALRHGTTHMEIKSGYGLNTSTELKLLNCGHQLSKISHLPSIEQTWLGAHSFPKEVSRSEYIESLLAEQLPAVVEQGYTRSADVFCEPGWFSIDESEQILKESRQLGLRLRIHIDEFCDGGGGELASELGVDTADHAYFTSLDARMKMRESNVNTGCLPAAPYVLGMDLHDYSDLLEADNPFTLATDFNPNCQFLSLPTIGSLAVQRSKLHPLLALQAITCNAAKISLQGTGSSEGRITDGGFATFNILHSKHWESWCQSPGTSPIHSTVLRGEHIIH